MILGHPGCRLKRSERSSPSPLPRVQGLGLGDPLGEISGGSLGVIKSWPSHPLPRLALYSQPAGSSLTQMSLLSIPDPHPIPSSRSLNLLPPPNPTTHPQPAWPGSAAVETKLPWPHCPEDPGGDRKYWLRGLGLASGGWDALFLLVLLDITWGNRVVLSTSQ